MRNRLMVGGTALGVVTIAAAVVLGAFALSDRLADEAIERVPIARTTSTPLPTSTRTAAARTPEATAVPDVVTSFMPHPDRQYAAAVVLADRRVLVVGGLRSPTSTAFPVSSAVLDSAVIYDPVNNEWSATAAPANQRWGGAMVLGGDGNPLIWGGSGTNQFGSILGGRSVLERYHWLTATWESVPLPNATVAVSVFDVGGRIYAVTALASFLTVVGPGGGAGTVSARARARLTRFDPGTGRWAVIDDLAGERSASGAFALSDGRVFILMNDRRPQTASDPTGSLVLNDPRPEFLVVDPRTGARGGVLSLPGPPYRAELAALADGAVLLFGGYNEDPTAFEAATQHGADEANAPPPPAPSEVLYRLDVDSRELTALVSRPGDPDDTFRFPDGTLFTTLLPSMPMTVDGVERLHAALEGRMGAVVLALDEHRVLVAGGSLATPEVETLVASLGDEILAANNANAAADIDAAIADAGLDAPELRYARPEAVIVRVN